MKKMRNKKGFTLAEVLIVVAIIVILAGATAVGVVSWLNNAKNAQNNVLSNNGDNFENAARLAVETANGTAPAWVGESATVNPVTTTTKETEGTTTKKETEGTTTSKETEGTTVKPTTGGSVTPNSGVTSGGGTATVSDYKSEWGSGSFMLNNSQDLQSCSTMTITITCEKDGKISCNGTEYNVKAGETLNITIKNESNPPYYTDPKFNNGNKLQVYFNFGGGDGQYYKHGMNVSVSAS